MCGRFALSTPPKSLAEHFRLNEDPELFARYNIAPTQNAPAVRIAADGSPDRRMSLLKWGLIPSWAKDASAASRMINARSETVAEKPAFRSAFKSRRCLVPADGYYEWQKTPQGKKPFFIRLAEDRPFALAGIWESWTDPEKRLVETFAILTTEANEDLKTVHDRMPVILRPRDYDLWLDPRVKETARLQSLLRACPAEEMRRHEVAAFVNSPANEGPRCIEPVQILFQR